MIDAKYSAVVGSACSFVCEAGSDREDRSSDVCYVGDTRWSFSAKMMTTSCTIISSVSCHNATRVSLSKNVSNREKDDFKRGKELLANIS